METWIEEYQLEALAALAKRLYTENRMNGDEMRDAAQLLDSIVRDLRGWTWKKD